MKFIKRDTDYAFQALIFLANNQGLYTIEKIAKILKLPKMHLKKIFRILSNNDIVVSIKGRNGGFKLNAFPGEITMAKIINIFQGKIDLTNCLVNKKICKNIIDCSIRLKLKEISQKLEQELISITLWEGKKMTKNIKGTETEKNLLKSFAGESQARNRYTYFSSVAKKEGYEQIAAIFQETADNEKEHAKIFFKYLDGGMVEITATYPAGVIGTTKENLLASANGENEEWAILYKNFGNTAKEEGFIEIADVYHKIAAIEKRHEERYREILKNLEAGTIFIKKENSEWKCRNCGYHYIGSEAPSICPACKHPKAYFEIFSEKY